MRKYFPPVVLFGVFVAALFLAHVGNIERIMFWAFIIGDVAYYAIGIALAHAFKDNRAFCKYVCPVTVFLKPMSYYSLLRITCDHDRCVECGTCRRVCPMDVDMLDDTRKRDRVHPLPRVREELSAQGTLNIAGYLHALGPFHRFSSTILPRFFHAGRLFHATSRFQSADLRKQRREKLPQLQSPTEWE